MTIPSEIKTFDGGLTAELILGKLKPDVDYLISTLATRNANSYESPILEIKGTWRKPPQDTDCDDYHKWNVVKALISMANAYGGCVIIGLAEGEEDKTTLVPLGCDPDHIMDDKTREGGDLISHTLKELFKGRTGTGIFTPREGVTYTFAEGVDRLKSHIDAYYCESLKYKCHVIVLVVHPLLNTEAIYVSHKKSEHAKTILFHRDHLYAGVKTIPDANREANPNDWTNYFEKRHGILHGTHFRQLLEQIPEKPKVVSLDEKEILRKLQDYRDKLAKQFSTTSNEVIQLYAKEQERPDWSEEEESDISEHLFRGFTESLKVSSPQSRKIEPSKAIISVPQTRVLTLSELFDTESRVTLIGCPGSGKSVSLVHYVLGKMPEEGSSTLYLYLPMRFWGHDQCESLPRFGQSATHLSKEQFDYLIERQRLVLVCDGLNECPNKYRDGAALAIAAFARENPRIPVIVSMRNREESLAFCFPIFSVQPMDEQQQLEFLDKRLHSTEHSQLFLQKIKTTSGLSDFLSNPLLLHMLSEVISEDSQLPTSRTQLYRKWMQTWFQREIVARGSPSHSYPFPDVNTALKALSSIALTASLSGGWVISRTDTRVAEILQPPALGALLESPILNAEGENISFRHPSYQEYLCAEALVTNPDAIINRSNVKDLILDDQIWSAPLAYAYELHGQDFPVSLLKASAKCNPWLAVAMLSTEKNHQTWHSILKPLITPEWSRCIPFIEFALGGPAPQGGATTFIRTIRQNLWYAYCGHDNTPLRTILANNSAAVRLWQNFEARMFLLLAETYFASTIVFQNFLALHFENLEGHLRAFIPKCERRIHKAVQNWHSLLEPHDVYILLKNELAHSEDFPPHIHNAFVERFEFLTANNQAKLLSIGFLKDEEVSEKIRWGIQSATPIQAARMVRSGLCPASSFKNRVPFWIKFLQHKINTPQEELCAHNTAVSLVRSGILAKEEIPNVLVTELTQNATVTRAAQLIQAGLAKLDAFAEKVPQWLSNASPNDLFHLLLMGAYKRHDAAVEKRIESIVNHVTSDEAAELVEKSLLLVKNFPSQSRDRIIKTTTPDNVDRIVTLGLADPEDFKHRASDWKAKASTSQMRRLIEAGLASPRDFKNKHILWGKSFCTKDLRNLLLSGILNKSDIHHNLKRLIDQASPTDALAIIKLCHIPRNAFSSRHMFWVQNSAYDRVTSILYPFKLVPLNLILDKAPESAIMLFRDGQLPRESIEPYLEQWEKECSVSMAILLCEAELIDPKDFTPQVGHWLKGIQQKLSTIPLSHRDIYKAGDLKRILLKQLMNLLDHRIIDTQILSSTLSPVVDSSTVFLAEILLESGLCERHSFAGRISSWMLEAENDPEVAEKLVQLDFVPRSDFTDYVDKWLELPNLPFLCRFIIRGGFLEIKDLPDTCRKPTVLKAIGRYLNISNEETQKMISRFCPQVNPAIPRPQATPPRPISSKPQIQIEDRINTSETTRANHITIYIDETWPGAQNPAYKNIGVLGGVVVPWRHGIRENILPAIPTHLKNGERIRQAIETLRKTESVFPFVLPLSFPQPTTAAAKYLELLQHGILILLGWLYPQPRETTYVDIFLEHISGFVDGHCETTFFQALTSALNILSDQHRFSRWKINHVEWQSKNFEYIPYGDLVCKTCVPCFEQEKLARDVNLTNWDGYLPFATNLFPLLRDMDTATPSGFADLLVLFAKSSGPSHLLRKIISQAISKAEADDAFRDSIFNSFEESYAQKDRNISLLNHLTRPFLVKFPISCFENRPRSMVIRLLVEIRNANHNGTPNAISQLVQTYNQRRCRLLAIDREFCAEIDMNLIVHYHDSLEFASALEISNEWITDPLFPALPLQIRGKMYSCHGQTLALLGDPLAAEKDFLKAIDLFSMEFSLLRADIEQTNVYRGISMLDHNPIETVSLIEALFHHSLDEIAANPTLFCNRPYCEHLFLRTLYLLRDQFQAIIKTYLENLQSWPTVHDYHPYELVLYYRTLLAKDKHPDLAAALIRDSESLFAQLPKRGILSLIVAYIRCSFHRLHMHSCEEETFNKDLCMLIQNMPATKPLCEKLSAAWKDSESELTNILPFNFK